MDGPESVEFLEAHPRLERCATQHLETSDPAGVLCFCLPCSVGKNVRNDEGNGEMAIASPGGFSSGHRPAGWRSARPGLIYA